MASPDQTAARVIALLDADGIGFLQLGFRPEGYRIGDQYETPCVATGLTISRDHLVDAHAHAGALRATAFFDQAMVPAGYRDRASSTGVVEIAIEIPLDDSVELTVAEPDGRWRTATPRA